MADKEKKTFMSISEELPQPIPVKEEDNVVTSERDSGMWVDPRVKKIIGDGISLETPKYTRHSKGSLHVSWAVIGNHYYYQIEMDKEPGINERDVIAVIGQAFLAVVPEHIHTYIQLPPAGMGLFLWTAIVKDSTKLMGAKKYMEKILVDKLLEIEFWP